LEIFKWIFKIVKYYSHYHENRSNFSVGKKSMVIFSVLRGAFTKLELGSRLQLAATKLIPFF